MTKLPAWQEPKSLSNARTSIAALSRSMHENAYLLGKQLLWVKAEVGHGNFLPWLEKNVKAFSERTANRVIDFAERCDAEKSLLEYHPRKSDTVSDLPPPLPPGKYRVIYADPPWQYRDSREQLPGWPGATKHYPTMSIEELCALDVKDLADPNAVLFMWTTTPLLLECAPVIEAWGFDYKTCFVWDKVERYVGHYLGVQQEFLFLCTRGSCLPEIQERPRSIVALKRTREHSEKPEEFRTLIDKLYPSGRRIELFARRETPGWDVWGNEASSAQNTGSERRLQHISGPLGGLQKEVVRRDELRQRLEAERGEPISDDDFIKIAEETGVKI